MSLARLNRRLTAWIATFAILVGALAPAVSHAVSWVSGGDFRWVEVCTVAGVRLVAVDAALADDDGQGELAGMFAERCPYCGTHAGSFGLPPAPAVSVALPAIPGPQSCLSYHAPRPLVAWATSHPRAPPRLS